jgi:hypothetical protein
MEEDHVMHRSVYPLLHASRWYLGVKRLNGLSTLHFPKFSTAKGNALNLPLGEASKESTAQVLAMLKISEKLKTLMD